MCVSVDVSVFVCFTHSLTHMCLLTLSHATSLLTFSLSLSLTHTHMDARAHTHTYTCTHTLSLSPLTLFSHRKHTVSLSLLKGFSTAQAVKSFKDKTR